MRKEILVKNKKQLLIQELRRLLILRVDNEIKKIEPELKETKIYPELLTADFSKILADLTIIEIPISILKEFLNAKQKTTERMIETFKKAIKILEKEKELSWRESISILEKSLTQLKHSKDKKFSEEELAAIEKVKEIKEAFNLTQEELAKVLGAGLRTVVNWLHSNTAPRRFARERILKLYEIYQSAKQIIKPQSLRKWLFTYNKALGANVFQLLSRGEYEKVLTDIEALKEGVFI